MTQLRRGIVVALGILFALANVQGSAADADAVASPVASILKPERVGDSPVGTLDGSEDLSRDNLLVVFEKEIRSKSLGMASAADNTPVPLPASQRRRRAQAKRDFSGLNRLFEDFVLYIPDANVEQPLLGFIATAAVTGQCRNIYIDNIDFDYEIGDQNLTLGIDVDNLDIMCEIRIDWDTGALDVEDDINVTLVVERSDIELWSTLQGSPPNSSTFGKCEIVLNVTNITSEGGFSSNIINDLDHITLRIIQNEMQSISDLLCDQVAGFTSVVDEQLETLRELVQPFLDPLEYLDPLGLELNLQVQEKLVRLDEGDIADIIDALVGSLAGVFGSDQINTLVEGNLLNENGFFVLDLAPVVEDDEEVATTESPVAAEDVITGGAGEGGEDVAVDSGATLVDDDAQEAEECSIGLRRNLQQVNRRLKEFLWAHVDQLARRRLQDSQAPLFALNDFTLNNVEITGLNTFSDADIVQVIGNYTLQSKFKIEALQIKAVATVDANVSEAAVREVVEVAFNISGINVAASYLVGLSDEVVGDFTIGTFLNTDDIVPCLLSSLVTVGISELNVTVDSIGVPVFKGVLSPGVDALINKGAEAAVLAYQDLLVQAVPKIFRDNVTDAANEYLECFIRVEASTGECPDVDAMVASLAGGSTPTAQPFTSDVVARVKQLGGSAVGPFYNAAAVTNGGFVEGYIDFRDLLLSPEEAQKLGGLGTQPYGDLIHSSFSVLQDQLVEIDNATGLPGINTMVLDALTELQSNVTGVMYFPEELLSFALDTVDMPILQSLMDRLSLALFESRIANINTLVSPVTILQPTTYAHRLENIFNFGPVAGRPLNFTTTLLMDLLGRKTPLELTNEVLLGAVVPELDVSATMRMMIPTADFLMFPIRDILNINCWFAMLRAPDLGFFDGFSVDTAVAITSFFMEIQKMSLSLKCLNCTSSSLPEAVELFDGVGATKLLGGRLGSLTEEVMMSDMVPPLLTDMLGLGTEAAKLCPHSPYYNSKGRVTNDTKFELPPLSAKSIDTLMYAGILGAEVFTVMVAESHLKNAMGPSNMLSAQESLNTTANMTLLDFTNLDDSFIPMAGDLLDFLRGYLGNNSDDGLLGVNSLVEDGVFDMNLDMTFNASDLNITVSSLRVKGLDSFTSFDVLQPIAPQTLLNTFWLEKLAVSLDMSVNMTTNMDPPQPYTFSFELEELNATIALFTLIDMGKLGSLELGSLLFIENILPCFLSMTQDISVPAMRVTVGKISEPTVEGLLPDTSQAVVASMKAMFDRFGNDLVAAADSMFDETIREIVNEFISSYLAEESFQCQNPFSDSFGSNLAVSRSSSIGSNESFDFRDLFLSPEESRRLGGSGEEPYGDLISTIFSMAQEQITAEDANASGLVGINSLLIEPFTESQSGSPGMMRLKEELFAFVIDELPIDFLSWLQQRMELNASDVRIMHANTVVSPLSLMQPTRHAYTLENIMNLGPVPNKPLNTTVRMSMDLEGYLSSLNMHNDFDISAAFDELDIFAALSVMVMKEKLFRFPLRDIQEMDCWFSLIQATDADNALELQSFMMKMVSMSMDLKCFNCTSISLPKLIDILDQVGVSETLGNRAGPLAEDISKSNAVPGFLNQMFPLGDDAARLCPHSPLFNTADNSIEDTEDVALIIPPLSELSLDTAVFSVVIAAEVVSVMVAESHLLAQDIPQEPVFVLDIPEGAKLLNWSALEESPVPFIADMMNLVRSNLNEYTDAGDGTLDLGVNVLMRGFLGDDGVFELPDANLGFQSSGLSLKVDYLRLEGIDSFSYFNALQPLSAETLQSTFVLDRVKMGYGIEVATEDVGGPVRHINFTMEMENINVTVPLIAAIDEDMLAAIQLGSLLHIENLLPCFLSASYGFRIPEMLVDVGNILAPSIEGLFPDTSAVVARSMDAVFKNFGDEIHASIPKIFDSTIRVFMNGLFDNIQQEQCQEYFPNITSRYVDFRELLAKANSPYGDLLPFLKGLLEDGLLVNNHETQMPKINDVLIGPYTEGQSGVEGTLLLPGQLFENEINSFEDLGFGKFSMEFSDALVQNLDSIGQPLQLLEANATSGFLLDNSAVIGTEFKPLRFAVKGTFALSGPRLETRDEMDIFGELRGAPIFLVLLAKLGAQELLTFPLGDISDIHCWFATIAAPALEEIASGKMKVEPLLSIDHLGIGFSSMRVSASCFNCTTPGLKRMPELLEIFESSGAKDLAGQRNVELLLDLLDSEFAQAWLLRIFQASLMECPHTANSTNERVMVPNADFPDLSQSNLETILFGASVTMHFGSVIMADTITTVGGSVIDFFDDPVLSITPGTRLVDFTALDQYPLGGLIETFLGAVNSFLSETTTDPATGEEVLAINELLADNPLGLELDSFSQDVAMDFGIDNLKLFVKSVRLLELDTLTKVKFANVTGPMMLHNQFSWQKLGFEMIMSIKVSDSPQLRRALRTDEDIISFTLEVELADVDWVFDLLLALDYDLLRELEIGNFLRTQHIIQCMQGAIRHMEITTWQFNVSDVTKFRITGFESPDIVLVSERLEEMILKQYSSLFVDALPAFFNVAVRPLANSILKDSLQDPDFECTDFDFNPSNEGFVDFRDLILSQKQSVRRGGSGNGQYGDLFSQIYSYSRATILLADGLSMLSPLLGNLDFPGVLVNQGIKMDVRDLKADMTIRVSDAKIDNLDNIANSLRYLDPVDGEAHLLNNSALIGDDDLPVQLKARIYMHVKGIGVKDIINDFDLQMDVHAINLVVTALAKMSEEAFVTFPLRDVLDIHCWLATIPASPLDEYGARMNGYDPTAAVTDLRVNFSKLNLKIKCHSCTSPALHEFAELLENPDSAEDMTTVANNILQAVLKHLGGQFLQDQIDRLLVEAPKRCRHANATNLDDQVYKSFTADLTSKSSFVAIIFLILVPLAAILIIAFSIRLYVHRRQKKWLEALPSERVFMIQQKQEKEDQKEAELNEITDSMFESKDIPAFVRYLIPVIVVLNIGFFLSGHLNLGAEVLIRISLGGETFELPGFFSFSIGQSTVDMWHAGGHALALLILIFSGVWPYTKQLITLALWFLRPSVVSCTRRGQFLLWLDLLAKWSMVDIFVILITLAGFRVEIDSPSLSFLPENLYSADLIVVPLWGLYANMIAQLISQISSHFIVHYHRKIVQHGTKIYDERHHKQAELTVNHGSTETGLVYSSQTDDEKEQLYRCKYTRQHKEEADKLIVRRYINFLLFFGAILLCILLVVSCDIPSLKLETLGLLGLVIELGQDLKEAVRYEGVFSMSAVLVNQARFLDTAKDYIGLGFLAFLFIFTCMVVPIIQILTLLFQWFVPLAEEGRLRVAVVLEIIQAWQYVEVYILAIIIESWQLGSVSDLMLNRFCTSLYPTFGLLAYYGVITEGDAQCFKLEASITAGAYLMVPIMFCLALLTTLVVKAVVQQLREKHAKQEMTPEDEKMRAFDRTTWDNRADAVKSIRPPPVLFTDSFRWTLCSSPGTGASNSKVGTDGMFLVAADTFPLAVDTSSSDGGDQGKPGKSIESSVAASDEDL